MKILFIRHGMTAGNLRKCYIGRTDEPLCAEGISRLMQAKFPPCEVLVSSPMRRCIQTAGILYPAQKVHTCDDLRECDFGNFEGKNYADLNGNPAYQAWIDSGGTLAFPGGESPQAFKERCCMAFLETGQRFSGAESLCFVVHGGTIMSVMEKYAVPHRDYYDWMIPNGRGLLCAWAEEKLVILEEL